MPYTYDDQLIESVALRRRRLAAALIFGRERLRRQFSDRITTFVISAFLAVLACAGCIAVSFVTNLLTSDPNLQRNRSAPVTPTVVVTAPASPTPSISGGVQ